MKIVFDLGEGSHLVLVIMTSKPNAEWLGYGSGGVPALVLPV